MTDLNPYEMPKSDVAIIDDTSFCDVKLFSVAGRLGRIRYLGYYFGITLLGAFVVGLAMALLGFLTTVLPENLALILSFVVMGGAYIFMIVVSVMLCIQRLHDINASGWWCLLFLVPVVNVILSIVLLFAPGTAGANRFGDETPPNSRGVIALASILPIALVVTLVTVTALSGF